MHASTELAARLLRFEQQLQAYQKLHGDELAELWRALEACKRDLTAALPAEQSNGPAFAKPAREAFLSEEEVEGKT